jgi:hypothetical protein
MSEIQNTDLNVSPVKYIVSTLPSDIRVHRLPEKAAMKSDVSQITMEIKLEISRFLLFL